MKEWLQILIAFLLLIITFLFFYFSQQGFKIFIDNSFSVKIPVWIIIVGIIIVIIVTIVIQKYRSVLKKSGKNEKEPIKENIIKSYRNFHFLNLIIVNLSDLLGHFKNPPIDALDKLESLEENIEKLNREIPKRSFSSLFSKREDDDLTDYDDLKTLQQSISKINEKIIEWRNKL